VKNTIILLAAAVVAGCLFRADAQNTPAFEVASVRLADPGGRAFGPPVRTSPDTLTIRGLSLRNCIQMAWQMNPTQVSAPDWMNDVRLDIVAKSSGPVEEKQLYVMLQGLLARRLSLKVHMEKKETSVYALTLAKDGPKFTKSTTDGPPEMTKDKDGVAIGKHLTMSDFAAQLAQPFGRPVVDSTGLTGRYDLRMDVMSSVGAEMAAATAEGRQLNQMDVVGVMIRALQEQLGLKVEALKDSIDFLVVDHAEKTPTDN